MRHFVSICDLCATEQKCTPATARFKFQNDWQDACESHLAELRHAHAQQNLPLDFEHYENPGDVVL